METEPEFKVVSRSLKTPETELSTVFLDDKLTWRCVKDFDPDDGKPGRGQFCL